MKDGSKASGEETSQKYLKEDSRVWREFRNKTRVKDKRRSKGGAGGEIFKEETKAEATMCSASEKL